MAIRKTETMNALILTFINMALCFAWGWSAMCRLGMIHKHVLLRIQLLYLFIFVASFFCGLQFYIFGTYAGWADVIASTVILCLLAASFARWRHGPPCDVIGPV